MARDGFTSRAFFGLPRFGRSSESSPFMLNFTHRTALLSTFHNNKRKRINSEIFKSVMFISAES